MTLTPREWEVLTGQVARSDDLAKALKADIPGQTVPVVRYEGMRRVVIGSARVEARSDGAFHATFELNSDSISKHYGILGPFSIGEPLPPKPIKLPTTATDKFQRALDLMNQDEEMNRAGDALVAFIQEHGITQEQLQDRLDQAWCEGWCSIHPDVMLEWDGYVHVCSRCILG